MALSKVNVCVANNVVRIIKIFIGAPLCQESSFVRLMACIRY